MVGAKNIEAGRDSIIVLGNYTVKSERSSTDGAIFVNISIDTTNPGWKETSDLSNPFKRECKQNFHLSLAAYNVEPCFDITIMNISETPVIMTDIGVEIVSVAAITYILGIPQAVKVKKVDTYTIEMPNVRAMIKRNQLQLPSQVDTQDVTALESPQIDTLSSPELPTGTVRIQFGNLALNDFPPTELNELVTIRIPDPIYLEPKAPYRYGLLLSKYHEHIPNHAILRLWIRANGKEEYSHEIHLWS